ncbi:MAG: aminotransferase class V-fold PLP-dependent enzyme [Anaerolineae bacterium]
MTPSTATHASNPVPTYASIGVRPLINCQGTYTILSGSRVLPQVSQAMAEASNHYVQMDELMEAVGKRLSELTGAEWGYITSGCAAALCEIACAAIAGADPEKMARLPDSRGMANEIIIQRAHRNAYDRALRMAGGEMVEVTTLAEYQAAFNERTALVAITGDQAHLGQIPVAEMIAIAHNHGVQCLVDAAAERPDLPNAYLALGADAVTYSGGKCLRGPQASGLALGRKDLLQAAWLNSAPHHGLARPMKAGKEEIMGLLAAVEAWIIGRDHNAEWVQWESWLATISTALIGLPSLTTTIEQPGIANVAPTLHITWNPDVLGCTPADIHQQLWQGEPRIAVHLRQDGLVVMPYMMEADEDTIVAARLFALLSTARSAIHPQPAKACCDVKGAWRMKVEYLLGQGIYNLMLNQSSGQLSGHLRTPFTLADINGNLQGERVTLTAQLGYQANQTLYCFQGTVHGDTMSGNVDLGEYGQAAWSAERT